MHALQIELGGQVQGVGLRPWLYLLAKTHGLTGTIGNNNVGAVARLEGKDHNLNAFLDDLEAGAPSPVSIETINAKSVEPLGIKSLTIGDNADFEEILGSQSETALWAAPPDLATCAMCWNDYFDPSSRFYLYPFVSCPACGPRWSILHKLPFNRTNTSYREFPMCRTCQAEYSDSQNRRFHSQTLSCANCGPKVYMPKTHMPKTHNRDQSRLEPLQTIEIAARSLAEGNVGAVKGLGGFQLLGSALMPDAIRKIRRIKSRQHQSLAVMFKDYQTFASFGGTAQQWSQMNTPAACIVSLKNLKLPTQNLIAPDLNETGAMVATTPLHFALLRHCAVALVTSANGRGFPIPKNVAELTASNSESAKLDFVLDHNREIANPVDDSVLRGTQTLRAARGLRPRQHKNQCTGSMGKVLAMGADLKNACAFAAGQVIVELPFQGTVETIEATEILKSRLEQSLQVFNFKPDVATFDFHPQTLTDRLLPERFLLKENMVKVPHHEAHALSTVRHLRTDAPVLILSFDGTGYNETSSTISQGGEGYLFQDGALKQVLSFSEEPLIGGDLAVRQPWRFATACLAKQGWEPFEIKAALQDLFENNESKQASTCDLEALEVIHALVARSREVKTSSNQLNLTTTTSAGRWFDAIASVLEFSFRSQTYEAQAPIRLETMAATASPSWPLEDCSEFQAQDFVTLNPKGSVVIEAGRLLSFLARRKLDLKAQLAITDRSQQQNQTNWLAYFAHDCLARVTVKAVSQLPVKQVAISGGVFQNHVFLSLLASHFKSLNIALLDNPDTINDQCIALGQVHWLQAQTEKRDKPCMN